MKSLKLLFSFIAIALILSSCDVIEAPYRESAGQDTSCTFGDFPVVTNPIRKVLLEDFTGHQCGNCPKAHVKAHDLANTYGNQLVIIGEHVSSFADTIAPEFITNYKTQYGDEIDQQFGPGAAGLPRGMVNRKLLNNNRLLSYTGWNTAISQLVTLPPDASISIQTNVNPTTQKLCVSAQTTFLKDSPNTYKVVYLIVEDSIISPQKDYSMTPEVIEDYEHRHVLRASLNGIGEAVNTSAVTTNQKFVSQYSSILPSNWNKNHLSVIVFIYDSVTYEIIQAEEKHL